MTALYAVTAGLQAADAHSTFAAIDSGNAVEANPLLRKFAANRPAMMTVKASTTGAMIYAMEKTWKRSPVRAIIAMVAINSVYAAVVMHNYRLAGRRSAW